MLNERLKNKQWFNRTTQELFIETCKNRPDKIAIVYQEKSITFNELQNNVNKVANALIKLGVKPGDRITTLPSSTPEFVYVYFATLQVGAVINPLNLLWGIREIESVLERNDPKIIITIDEQKGKNYIELLRSAIPDLNFKDSRSLSSERIPSLTNMISLSQDNLIYDGFLDLHYLMEQTDSHDEDIKERMKEQKNTDIQFICQTSGTTGLSKSALWDHRPPLATVNFSVRNIMYDENDSYINFGPFFHNSGITAINLTLAYTGTTLYLLEDFNSKKALEYIEKYKITTTFGFSAHWQGLLKDSSFTRSNFYIRKALVAGDAKTYEMARDMCSGSKNIVMLYAQTESGPLISLGESDCMNDEINKYTHGRPLPGVEVIIKSLETGQELTNAEGEICYRSPFMFKGYYKQSDETKKVFDKDGYFHSGDFGNFRNGYITYLGRLGGVIKSGGENVSTSRVTTQLVDLLQDDIEDAQTVGIDDEYWGKKVVSWIQLKSNIEEVDTKVLRHKLKGQMADYEIPKEILVWKNEWPITAEGKIDFKKLAAEAEKVLT
ncbi:class I adenylate-forming enzyme family protein [Oceanobacillus salinisoli]|uniref:class I adenylate-forming enzyme family protein n=1 Tax=Oceanobacillus salinisoli TaxID=2678611 RepID=UPI0018CC7831|nr:class I adenylate-forming enzyme family protein [Oceanobacillus salinisoli]